MLNNLKDVYVAQLKDMYSAEKQLTEALPKMVTASSDPALKEAFEHHLQVTEGHLETVKLLLSDVGANPGSKVCKAMEGLIEEGNEVAKEEGNADAKDAGIIVAAQKIEHYEISTYGSLVTFAESLGYEDAAETLQALLDDEYEANQILDSLAMGTHERSEAGINAEANI